MRLNRYYRHKKTGKVSRLILNLIEDSITLKKNAATINLMAGNTPFEEIEVVTPLDTLSEEYKELSKVKAHSVPISWNKFIDKCWETYLTAVDNVWDDDKFHMVMHSSGYDSRIMSLALKQLHKENLLFVCLEPEGSVFENIMKHQAWSEDKYMVYNKGISYDEYYKEGLDYDLCLKITNGPSERPVNPNGVAYYCLQAAGKIDKDENMQFHANQFAEILNSKVVNFEHYYKEFYYSRFSRFWSTFDCKVSDNYLDFDLMKFMMEAKVSNWHTRDQLREEMIRQIDPHMLKFKRWTWNEVYGQNFFKLSDRLHKKAVEDYKNSWFYKNIDKDINSTSKYMVSATFKWWQKWSMGAVTDYLVSKGCNIKF